MAIHELLREWPLFFTTKILSLKNSAEIFSGSHDFDIENQESRATPAAA
ncbi:hypothetical protein LFL97_14795 [Burkholderia sp. JSH-S8]|nr:hypothetical protein [Burkholderia stagnalis]WGS40966.1 hypothetical protein LFL97_14795 [Burkholderia sp. JSH-S8]